MFRRYTKDSSRYAAVIDIGSSTVGVGIIRSAPDETEPHILFTERVMVRTQDQEPGIRKLEEILLSSSLTLSQKGIPMITQEHSHARLSSLYVICAAPWSKTDITHLHHTETQPYQVTQAHLDELIAQNEHLSHKEPTKDTETQSDLETVERAVLSIALNGYEIKHIRSVRASQVDISYAAGKYHKALLPIIRDIHTKLFQSTHLNFHTQMLISYCVIRDMFPRNVHALIINITGEATECGVIEDGNLVHTDTLPYGFHTLIRKIMHDTNKPFDDVVTLLRNSHTALHEETLDLSLYTKDFDIEFARTLTRMTDVVTLPDTTFITTQESFEPLFNKLIHTTLKQQIGENCTIIPLTTALLQHNPKEVYRDAYFNLAARFFHKVAFDDEKKY